MRPLRAIALTTLALVLVTATASCSSDSGGSGTSTTGLESAMRSVSGSGAAQDYLAFSDVARMRKLGILDQGTQPNVIAKGWELVVGNGAQPLADVAALLPSATGVDFYRADTAITIGQPPHVGLRLDGPLEPAKVTSKLQALGARPRSFGGTAGLSFGADNAINPDNPLYAKLALVNQANQIVVDRHGIATAADSATLQQVRGQGTSLLETGSAKAIAGCLGDVIAATIVKDAGEKHAAYVAVGVRDPGSKTGTRREVVCLLPAPGQGDAVEKAARAQLTLDARDPISGAPLSTYLSAATVDTAGALVRATLTLREGTPSGYVLQGLVRRAARYWDGTCAAGQIAGRTC